MMAAGPPSGSNFAQRRVSETKTLEAEFDKSIAESASLIIDRYKSREDEND